MKLTSSDGTRFKLSVVDYQFPELNHSHDANWLIIKVSVDCPQGAWSVADPSLETYDLARLADWLEALPLGVDGRIGFTEPCLEFELIGSDRDDLALRVCLAYELAPPWLGGSKRSNGFTIEFPLNELDLKSAVQSLRRMLEKYPQRPNR